MICQLAKKNIDDRTFFLRIFIRLIQFVIYSTLLAFFTIVFIFLGIKFLAWNSIEKYSAGDNPNNSFVVLVDIPDKIDILDIETHIWPWHLLKELDGKFPGWKFHSGPMELQIESTKDSYFSKYHGYFSYETTRNNNETNLIMIEHWTSDDSLFYSEYYLKGNKIYPVMYQKKASFNYATTVFFPSILIAFIMILITNRYLFKKYIPILSSIG